MISVFTPSHDSKYLDDAYKSLKAQTDQAWEWIVLLNGDADWGRPEYDDRVRVSKAADHENGCVGALKSHAVSLCEGSILVELDHDDILKPTALEKIRAAFEDKEVAFVYSDFAQINGDGTPNHTMFDTSYGWEYYTEPDGPNLVCRSMDHSPHNVSYIWYAPNHVRAFTREAYDNAGGYDASKKVLDDQDLIARIYLQGKFHHIKECLYYQRVHDNNTQKGEFNAFIQTETVRLHGQTIQMVSRQQPSCP